MNSLKLLPFVLFTIKASLWNAELDPSVRPITYLSTTVFSQLPFTQQKNTTDCRLIN
jgi:hypothetical protein